MTIFESFIVKFCSLDVPICIKLMLVLVICEPSVDHLFTSDRFARFVYFLLLVIKREIQGEKKRRWKIRGLEIGTAKILRVSWVLICPNYQILISILRPGYLVLYPIVKTVYLVCSFSNQQKFVQHQRGGDNYYSEPFDKSFNCWTLVKQKQN